MARGLRFVSLLILLGASSSSAFNVFGTKELRKKIESPTGPYKMIGKLFTTVGKATYECTASLVGPDLILTNLHCIDALIENNNEGKIAFYPFYKRGKALVGSQVKTYSALFQREKNKITYEYDNDWAILTLEKPLGLQLGWFQIAPSTDEFLTSSPKETVTLAGYNFDIERGEVLSAREGCRIREVEAISVLHDCDMVSGTSGGPIFYKDKEGQYKIVALNYAERLDGLSEEEKSVHLNDEDFLGLRLNTYSPAFANLAVNTKSFAWILDDYLKRSLARSAKSPTTGQEP